jgi:membrane protein
MKEWFRNAWETLKETAGVWQQNQAFQMAGALAFYTMLSIAPLLLVVVSVSGIFFGEDAVTGELSYRLQEYVGDDAADLVERAVRESRIEQAGVFPTLIGVGAVLFGATTVFAQLQTALNRIWGLRARPSRSGVASFLLDRGISLAAVLLIGILLLATVLFTTVLSAVIQFAEGWVPLPPGTMMLIDVLVSLLLATALFATIYKILPDADLSWRDMWRGAGVTALLFVLGQFLISQYLTRFAPGSAYGAAGSLVLLLVWVYYSSLILFFGAAFTRVSMRRRGVPVEPRWGAVKVEREIVGEPEDDDG